MFSRKYNARRLKIMSEQVKGESVLDVGHAQLPNPYLKGLQVTGFDIIRAGGLSYKAEVQGDIKDIRELLNDEVFDTILCGEFIEHVEDPYVLLRSLKALMADDGRLVLSTPNPIGFPVVFLELLRNKHFFYTEQHTHYFLPRWVERMLTRTGFSVTDIIPVGLWCANIVLPSPVVAASYQIVYIAEHA